MWCAVPGLPVAPHHDQLHVTSPGEVALGPGVHTAQLEDVYKGMLPDCVAGTQVWTLISTAVHLRVDVQ